MLRRLFAQKWVILVVSLVATTMMILLASGLHDVQFEPGHSLGRAESRTVQVSIDQAVQEVVRVPLWKRITYWLLLFVLVLLISALMTPEGRKRLIRMFLVFVASFWAIFYLLENNLLTLPDLTMGAGDEASAAALDEIPPLPVFTPPDLPGWVNYLISVGVVLALLALTWSLHRLWQRIKLSSSAPDALKDLASVARSSLRDLSDGADWADAITNCYVRMSEVVSHKRGLYRQAAMTPAEFAYRLERAGLPGNPVRRLTRLFESARYGAHKPAQTEINEAVSCLNAILHYCGEDM